MCQRVFEVEGNQTGYLVCPLQAGALSSIEGITQFISHLVYDQMKFDDLDCNYNINLDGVSVRGLTHVQHICTGRSSD